MELVSNKRAKDLFKGLSIQDVLIKDTILEGLTLTNREMDRVLFLNCIIKNCKFTESNLEIQSINSQFLNNTFMDSTLGLTEIDRLIFSGNSFLGSDEHPHSLTLKSPEWESLGEPNTIENAYATIACGSAKLKAKNSQIYLKRSPSIELYSSELEKCSLFFENDYISAHKCNIQNCDFILNSKNAAAHISDSNIKNLIFKDEQYSIAKALSSSGSTVPSGPPRQKPILATLTFNCSSSVVDKITSEDINIYSRFYSTKFKELDKKQFKGFSVDDKCAFEVEGLEI